MEQAAAMLLCKPTSKQVANGRALTNKQDGISCLIALLHTDRAGVERGVGAQEGGVAFREHALGIMKHCHTPAQHVCQFDDSILAVPGATDNHHCRCVAYRADISPL